MIVPEPAPAGPLAATRPETAEAPPRRAREGGARDFNSVLAGEPPPAPPVAAEPGPAPAPAPAVPGAVPLAMDAAAAAPVGAPAPQAADPLSRIAATPPRTVVPETPAPKPAEAISEEVRVVVAEPDVVAAEAETEAAKAAEPVSAAPRSAPGSPALPASPAPPTIPLGASPAPDAPPTEHALPAPEAMRVAAPELPARAKPPAAERVAEVSLRDTAPPAWQLAPEPAAAPRHAEPAAATPSVPAAAEPRVVIGQVAVAIGKASGRDVEIRLDPPELGRVQIHLTPLDGGVQAVVLAQRPETQDLLRRHADLLAQELGAAGFGTVSLDFGGGEAATERDTPPALGWHAASAAAVPEGQPAHPSRPVAGGLDIRL